MSTPNSKEKSSQKTEDKTDEIATTKYLPETVKTLQTENEDLKIKLTKIQPTPSAKICIIFAIFGAASLGSSLYTNSAVLAFIGLGLVFWGALFFIIKPTQYVPGSLLDSTAIASYSTLDRIIKDLNYKGKSFYIPPYPRDVFLPEHLSGLKDMIVFISADSKRSGPSVEELAKSKFMLENPKGITVAPPGIGLLTKFENELRRDFSKFSLPELSERLPKLVVDEFQLAKDMELRTEENQIHIKIIDSIYKELYNPKENLKSIHLLGCPLISAIACAIAKSTGKITTIQKDSTSPDNNILEVWYRTS